MISLRTRSSRWSLLRPTWVPSLGIASATSRASVMRPSSASTCARASWTSSLSGSLPSNSSRTQRACSAFPSARCTWTRSCNTQMATGSSGGSSSHSERASSSRERACSSLPALRSMAASHRRCSILRCTSGSSSSLASRALKWAASPSCPCSISTRIIPRRAASLRGCFFSTAEKRSFARFHSPWAMRMLPSAASAWCASRDETPMAWRRMASDSARRPWTRSVSASLISTQNATLSSRSCHSRGFFGAICLSCSRYSRANSKWPRVISMRARPRSASVLLGWSANSFL